MILTLLLLGSQASSIDIPRVALLPDRPSPYLMRDWRKVAVDFDRLVFDQTASGRFMPLIWRVPNGPNLNGPGFGIPSYVGNESQRGQFGEGICCMGAVLGSTVAGIDKSSDPVNWVSLTEQYLNKAEGTVLNNPGARSGVTFWYEILPAIDFTQISERYPKWVRGRQVSKGVAETWLKGIAALGGNWDHTSFNFGTMKPFDNGLWKEPDASAGVSYLELMEGLRSGDSKYVQASRAALQSLQNRDTNPTYETLTCFGALTAAYLNAEKGDHWDVTRFVNWSLEPTSPYRVGWGMVAGPWGGYDTGGLLGSVTDSGGYAFAMNTFINAATLTPIARYDDRLSAPLGKWILNLANAARLFYRNGLPSKNQSSYDWTQDKMSSISYEGMRASWLGVAPYATGDAKRGNSKIEDFGLYGGGYVGLLGGLVHTTDVPMILCLDLRATDFLPNAGYPTHLFWNPYDSAKTIHFDLGTSLVRPYDVVKNKFLASGSVRGVFTITLSPKQAIQLVSVPPTGLVNYVGAHTLVSGVTIDYNNGRVPLRIVPMSRRVDHSRQIAVPSFAEKQKWNGVRPIVLGPSPKGTLNAELRFRWDKRYLYFRIDQTTKGFSSSEAPTSKDLETHPWDYDNVNFGLDPSRERYSVKVIPEITVGFSSAQKQGLGFSAELPAGSVETRTMGTAMSVDRAIEGKVAWHSIALAIGSPNFRASSIRRGFRLNCQPLLTDGNFERQSYIGGATYTRPSGFDTNSRTLVLVDH